MRRGWSSRPGEFTDELTINLSKLERPSGIDLARNAIHEPVQTPPPLFFECGTSLLICCWQRNSWSCASVLFCLTSIYSGIELRLNLAPTIIPPLGKKLFRLKFSRFNFNYRPLYNLYRSIAKRIRSLCIHSSVWPNIDSHYSLPSKIFSYDPRWINNNKWKFNNFAKKERNKTSTSGLTKNDGYKKERGRHIIQREEV